MTPQDKLKPEPPDDDDEPSGSGWGPNHDQPNPFIKFAKSVKKDVSETLDDAKDEPSELPTRIGERLRSYLPGATRPWFEFLQRKSKP